MKSTCPNFVRTIARYVSEVAASEAGELLSVRRKWHLLEAERYARLAAETAKEHRQTAPVLGHRIGAPQRTHGPWGIARHA